MIRVYHLPRFNDFLACTALLRYLYWYRYRPPGKFSTPFFKIKSWIWLTFSSLLCAGMRSARDKAVQRASFERYDRDSHQSGRGNAVGERQCRFIQEDGARDGKAGEIGSANCDREKPRNFDWSAEGGLRAEDEWFLELSVKYKVHVTRKLKYRSTIVSLNLALSTNRIRSRSSKGILKNSHLQYRRFTAFCGSLGLASSTLRQKVRSVGGSFL